ncbi:putative capsid protein [Water beetle associated circular virus 1]|uniref:putative capsid protein n=1 Tax=Water beetle associated circular virus 1 TaxID=2293309 RepID=UPI000E32E0FF|nr:putative capsid protein [Water beetle associated circular virus 1]AXL65916.1 putative capsid protein [Water beetle associated circular virus 1]
MEDTLLAKDIGSTPLSPVGLDERKLKSNNETFLSDEQELPTSESSEHYTDQEPTGSHSTDKLNLAVGQSGILITCDNNPFIEQVSDSEEEVGTDATDGRRTRKRKRVLRVPKHAIKRWSRGSRQMFKVTLHLPQAYQIATNGIYKGTFGGMAMLQSAESGELAQLSAFHHWTPKGWTLRARKFQLYAQWTTNGTPPTPLGNPVPVRTKVYVYPQAINHIQADPGGEATPETLYKNAIGAKALSTRDRNIRKFIVPAHMRMGAWSAGLFPNFSGQVQDYFKGYYSNFITDGNGFSTDNNAHPWDQNCGVTIEVDVNATIGAVGTGAALALGPQIIHWSTDIYFEAFGNYLFAGI